MANNMPNPFTQMQSMMQNMEPMMPHNVIPMLMKGSQEVAKAAAEVPARMFAQQFDAKELTGQMTYAPQADDEWPWKARTFSYYPAGNYYQYGNKTPLF